MMEPWVRPVAFIVTFLVMFAFESFLPRKERTENRLRRNGNNLLLSVFNSFAMRFVPLLSAVGAAAYAESQGWGLLNWTSLPLVVKYGIALIAFDLIIYWQHVASHHVPSLWKFHQVHHADHDLDASSGLRFHPIEIAFSMGIKCLAVLAIGAPPESVVLFEIILNSCALFNHSNVHLPVGFDRVLRWFIVTPDMHRVHHSVYHDETNSNYGFNIPWWDRLFGTYQAQPRDLHSGMRLGLPEYPNSQQTIPFWSMLKMPFAGKRSDSSSPSVVSPSVAPQANAENG